MNTKFEVKRDEIVKAAATMLGLPFVHQGRDPEVGVDCVGLLVVMGRIIGYPDLVDAEAYRRTPSAFVIRDVLAKNCDEIPMEEVGVGDIYLMRTGGIKPRHTAIVYSDENGVRYIIHAARSGVKVERKDNYPDAWFVSGFRVRGLVE